MTWNHPRGYLGLEKASKYYAQSHKVSIRWDRRSLQSFADAPIEELAASYDLVVLDHPHVGLISESNCLLPLPEPPADISIGGSLESYFWNGQLWAFPIDAACQVAVKCSDLKPVELPDWEAVLDGSYDAPLLTPLLPVDAFDMMMTLIAGLGEEILPHSPNAFCSDRNGLLALRVLKSLYKSGPAEAVGWSPIDVLEILSTSDDFAYCPCLFGYINYARRGFRDHVVQYCDLPSFRGYKLKRGILGGAGIGVSSKSAHPETAIAFAQWVASEPVQSGLLLDNEGQPGHRHSWLKMKDDPRFSGFLGGAFDTMENAWTRPRNTWFLGFVDAVCEIFPAFFTQDRSEADFLRDINALYVKHKS
ncbi:MAG: hypothetical protein AAF557_28105 [Pseudomonadota bacterium]